MIKLMLVAGENSEKLAMFLEQRGTFSVEFWTPNLANVEELQNKIIKVDKMLYLYQTGNASVNIKSEMHTLQILIRSDGFFDPGEIVFIAKKSDETDIALRYFKSVMQSCNYSKYNVQILKDELSFSAIYSSILGTSRSRNFTNTYRNVYRVERDADADVAFSPSDDRNLIIEPFNYDSLREYEHNKVTIEKVDSGYVYTDNRDTNLKTYANPALGRIDFEDVVDNLQTVIVAGSEGSGKSVWSAALAASAVLKGGTVLVLDYTRNQEIGIVAAALGETVTKVGMKDLLLAKQLVSGIFNLCSFMQQEERNVRFEFLQHLCTAFQRNCCIIILAVELEDLTAAEKIIRDSLIAKVFSVTPTRGNISRILPYTEFEDGIRKTVVMNQNSSLLSAMQYVDATTMREMIDIGVKVVKPVTFSSKMSLHGIYDAITGGEVHN